ncbi:MULTISPECIES: SDR family NAD(P)-dependent oxidoreductase [unclassified Micromonospora]|uniref:SDR family NAD(P)-dependent oxidoreductase n=1 Tax=unclassified Micromonospora TaxID=2617518 RepID=UPI0033B56FB6
MHELNGKVAVVTGAAQGIGRAVAFALAEQGARVALLDRDGDGVARAAAELGDRALALAVDVGDEAAVTEAADRVERKLGPLAVWVNNAGITRPAMLPSMSADDFDLVLRVHARGTFLGLREAARRMGAGGSIINVTSSAGLDGTIGQINYAAAKGAIVAMTKSAARELGKAGIRVNAVSPAAATPMTEKIRTDERFAARYLERIPLRRWGEPDEVAEAFVFLAGATSRYVTGQVLCVDGGTYMAS